MTKLLAFLKGQGSLFVVLAILAAAAILAVVPKPAVFTGLEVYGILMTAAGAAGVLAGNVLGSTQPNTNVIPHLVFMLAAIGLCLAMGLEHVFNDSQVLGVFTAFLGGGAAGIAVSSTSTPAPTPVAPPAVLTSVPQIAEQAPAVTTSRSNLPGAA